MMMAKNCPKCASERWMTGLKPLLSSSAVLTVCVTPETWLEGRKGVSDLRVSVCADCGYVEWHAVTPEAVWDEWRKHHP